MFFIKQFSGVLTGQIYPTVFSIGDECPDELIEAATDAGVISPEVPEPSSETAANTDALIDAATDAGQEEQSTPEPAPNVVDSAQQSVGESEVGDDSSKPSKKPSARKR